MEYISTRGQDGPLGYEQALLSGLARDGGLYLPVSYPRFGEDEIRAMAGLSYAALAGRIMARFTEGEIDEGEMTAMAADAYGVKTKMMGWTVAKRQTFIIDPAGNIAKHYEKVDPDEHSAEVLADLEALGAGD